VFIITVGKRRLENSMDRLAEILADMVRSALAWEKEHGAPPNNTIKPKHNPIRASKIRLISDDMPKGEVRYLGNIKQEKSKKLID
jgi:hypothetical protein